MLQCSSSSALQTGKAITSASTIPKSHGALMVREAMGHRQIGPRLRTALDAKPAQLANEVRDTDAFALDVLPELRVHRAAFELDDSVAKPLHILRHVSAAHRAKGYLPKEAEIRFECETWHGDNLIQPISASEGA